MTEQNGDKGGAKETNKGSKKNGSRSKKNGPGPVTKKVLKNTSKREGSQARGGTAQRGDSNSGTSPVEVAVVSVRLEEIEYDPIPDMRNPGTVPHAHGLATESLTTAHTTGWFPWKHGYVTVYDRTHQLVRGKTFEEGSQGHALGVPCQMVSVTARVCGDSDDLGEVRKDVTEKCRASYTTNRNHVQNNIVAAMTTCQVDGRAFIPNQIIGYEVKQDEKGLLVTISMTFPFAGITEEDVMRGGTKMFHWALPYIIGRIFEGKTTTKDPHRCLLNTEVRLEGEEYPKTTGWDFAFRCLDQIISGLARCHKGTQWTKVLSGVEVCSRTLISQVLGVWPTITLPTEEAVTLQCMAGHAQSLERSNADLHHTNAKLEEKTNNLCVSLETTSHQVHELRTSVTQATAAAQHFKVMAEKQRLQADARKKEVERQNRAIAEQERQLEEQRERIRRLTEQMTGILDDVTQQKGSTATEEPTSDTQQ